MSDLTQQLRFALRGARRRPLVTVVVVATLALGIGATTAIVSLLHAVLIRPLPYEQPERLVTVWMDLTRVGGPADEWASWDNFNDWRALSDSFESMTAIGGWRPTMAGNGEVPPQQLQGGAATADVFTVLGRHASLGRDFERSEDRAESEQVVLLGHHLYSNRLAADPSVLGSTLELDGEAVRIIGVLPPDFELPFVGAVDALRPLRVDASNSCGRGCVNQRVVARLRPGVALGVARDEMSAIASSLEEQYPAENAGVGTRLIPLHERVTGRARGPLLVLLGAVVLILLTACANVAGVQLARALSRRDELALRTALGASRGQLVRQLLLESLVLAGLGGLAGIALGALALGVLRRLAAEALPRLAEATLDGPTLALSLAATVLTGLAVGTVPALRGAGGDLRTALTERGSGRRAGRLRGALVAAEVAVAVILVVGTGLLGRSLLELVRLDLGFDPRGALVARVPLPTDSYREPERRVELSRAALERIAAMPGVEAVTHTNAPPLAGNDGDTHIDIDGRAAAPPGHEPVLWIRAVGDGYLSTMKMPLLQGRDLRAEDRSDAAQVLLVNETAARRYWPDGNAIGARVNFNQEPVWREVVGIVADTRHFGLTEPARPAAYLPWRQVSFGSPYFIVRGSGSPLARVPAFRQAIAAIDPTLAVAEIGTLDELVDDASASQRLTVSLLVLFALSALLLAAIGMYGVMSYVALQRRREMGVRQTLGATPGAIRRLLLAQAFTLAASGLVAGGAVAAIASRAFRSLLFQVQLFDPATWILVPAIVISMTLLASWLPARRAASPDIVRALRQD